MVDAPDDGHRMFNRVLESIGKEVAKHVRERLKPLEDRISALEQRLAAAEKRRGLHYRGTWADSTEYGHGDAVTHGGSLWVCLGYGVRSKPGSCDSWKLVHKGDLPNEQR